jgi:ribosomal protein L7/L12
MTDVQWNNLMPILQEITERLSRIEQFLAASGLQAPAQPVSLQDFGAPGSVNDAGPMQAFSPPQAPVSSDSQIPDYILTMVKTGNLVGAIKEYREAAGVSLKEAKSVIDQVARGF